MRALAAQALRYFLGACAGLAADWLAWSVAWRLLGMPGIAAQCLGKAIGGGVAFHVYRTRVFAHEEAVCQRDAQLRRFLVALAGGWCTGVCLFAAFSLLLSPVLAKVATDGVTFVLNWFVMREWVFRKAGGDPGGRRTRDLAA